MTSKNTPFCLAPWIHAHINVQGKRALCCYSEGHNEDFEPLDKFWNSEVMKKARLDMMSGKPSPELCGACTNNPATDELPMENFNKFKGIIPEILEKTSSDGHFEGSPFLFDYRLSNQCNISCRMCNAESSSKIEHGILNISDTSEDEKEKLKKKKAKNDEVFIPELLEKIDRNEVKRMNWASGEAFLQASHWMILDRCIDSGTAGDIDLHYITNLAYPFEHLAKHLDRLAHFREVALFVSIDSANETVEFIRDGLNWNRFVKNLEQALSCKVLKVKSFSITLTVPTLLEMRPFLKFLYNYKIPFNVDICHPTGVSGLFSPLFLRRGDLRALINRARKEILSYDQPEYFEGFLKIFRLLESSPVLEEKSVDWRRDVSRLIEKAVELDKYFKRESVIDYYYKYDITKCWLTDIMLYEYLPANRQSESSFPYWDNVHKKSVGQADSVAITHTYNSIEDHKDFYGRLSGLGASSIKYLSVVGSAPTPINRLLSRGSHKEKFLLHRHFSIESGGILNEYPNLKIIQRSYLGIFSFLLKDYERLSSLAKVLDWLVSPFKKIVAFHYYVLIQIDED